VIVQFFVKADNPCIISWPQSDDPLSGFVVRAF
jgi:hypothetical protein